MLTVEEFYAFVGEDFEDANEAEKKFAGIQIQVGENAIRNYCRRFISPMVWEDRFQRPNIITLHETPTIYVDRVIADGHRVPETDYYFYPPSSRLFTVHDHVGYWPYGNMAWLNYDHPPEEMPQYYGNWKGVGSLKVLYKAGYVPVPPVLKQVIADYVYERVLARRALSSSGGTPIPVGTISQIQIEGVGQIRYSEGASTTANASPRAQRSGEPIIGAAGPLLDAYLEIATVVPGLKGLISHRPVTPLVVPESRVTWNDLPESYVLYSDDPGDYVTYANANAAPEVMLLSANPKTFSMWNGVVVNGTVWEV